jgi:hypothetical protein
MTLSAHYFFGAKQYYEGVLALVVIANVIMFMTWGLTKSTGKCYIFFIDITRCWTEIQFVTNLSNLVVSLQTIRRLVVYLPYVRLCYDPSRYSTIDHWQQDLVPGDHSRVRFAQWNVIFDLAYLRSGNDTTYIH